MLTEKDYCDYDTSRELKELGFPIRRIKVKGEEKHVPILLYEAQEFLREEKAIIVEANFDLMYKGQPRFSWRALYNLTQHKGCYYTFDSVESKEDYDSYEEALSEGIKEAVKILKEK